MKTLFYSFSIFSILLCWQTNTINRFVGNNSLLSDWEFIKKVDGIKIFTKEVEHSNLKELKIEMTFEQTRLSDIISVINKGENYQDWLYKCSHSENISRTGFFEKIDYFQLDFPWPLSDRDVYNRSVMYQDSVTKVLTISSDPIDTFEEREGFVRVKQSKTRWYFYPKENGDVFLEYQTASSPAGNIPDWLVNMVIDKGPTQTMRKLRQLIAENKGSYEPIEWIQN